MCLLNPHINVQSTSRQCSLNNQGQCHQYGNYTEVLLLIADFILNV